MQWLNNIVDALLAKHHESEILIETGSSPSGTYHLGHLREVVTADAIFLEVKRRNRQARHIQFLDDLDALRKIPVNIPADYEQYLGQPLSDIPAPDGSSRSYGEYFEQGLVDACQTLGINMEFVHAHLKYRDGFYIPAIERALERLPKVRQTLEEVSGRHLDDNWSPIQVLEDGRLKKRKFLSIDTNAKTLEYENADGQPRSVDYTKGAVKLDWRLDFPAHWWLQGVACEPSGRDHSTKGGSVETGEHICRDIYGAEPPLAVPYDFINMAGDTKKMSASKGTGLDAIEGSKIMPPEVVRFFILRFPPSKRLYFDPVHGVVQLMDEFAALAAKLDKTEGEEQLLYLCTKGQAQKTVSRVPFSHLVASYQASLKDSEKTLDVIKRTEYAQLAEEDAEIIKNELKFIDNWLETRAPEDVKFALAKQVDLDQFNEQERTFLKKLGDKVASAPADANGHWFHLAIYELKDELGMEPKIMFSALYKALIDKTSGPRAGWFLSILPRDWLVERLHLEA